MFSKIYLLFPFYSFSIKLLCDSMNVSFEYPPLVFVYFGAIFHILLLCFEFLLKLFPTQYIVKNFFFHNWISSLFSFNSMLIIFEGIYYFVRVTHYFENITHILLSSFICWLEVLFSRIKISPDLFFHFSTLSTEKNETKTQKNLLILVVKWFQSVHFL